jgi:hypothetical protein
LRRDLPQNSSEIDDEIERGAGETAKAPFVDLDTPADLANDKAGLALARRSL